MVDPPQTILVVDDERNVRASTQKVLEYAGYRVLTAEEGAQGLALLERHHADIALVLLDLSMPGMTGEETLGAIRRHFPGIPVVLCSGSDEPLDFEQFDPVPGFLDKPFNSASLLAIVRATLNQS